MKMMFWEAVVKLARIAAKLEIRSRVRVLARFHGTLYRYLGNFENNADVKPLRARDCWAAALDTARDLVSCKCSLRKMTSIHATFTGRYPATLARRVVQ